jgi:hypothetical protein
MALPDIHERQQRDYIRTKLNHAQRMLAARLERERHPEQQDLLRLGHSAIRDALAYLEGGTALMVLAALNGFTFVRLDVKAARSVEEARRICRGLLLNDLADGRSLVVRGQGNPNGNEP